MHASAHTLPRARTSRPAGAIWDADALAAVWESQRDIVGERLTVIEQATHALAEDRLDAELRDRAQRAAHMLAGSLGMFGFQKATRAARGLESRLSHPTQHCAPVLSALLARIRSDIDRPTARTAASFSSR